MVLDAVSGHIDAMLRLRTTVRGINSDDRSSVIAVTIDGDVVLGDLQGEPSWITLLNGNYLSAGLW